MYENRASCGPVLVVDDDPAVLELMELALSDAGHATCCASSGEGAFAALADEAISAAVLDVNLPDRSGYEVCREIRRLHGPGLPIVFVSGERREAYDRIGGLLLGADDYLVKPFDPRELVARLDLLLRRARAAQGDRPLTRRELEVLELLAEGLPNKAIAARLGVSDQTVKFHVAALSGKLGAANRTDAVRRAVRQGLISL
jgi:DNA-binding NarL/FixJ family response regulator